MNGFWLFHFSIQNAFQNICSYYISRRAMSWPIWLPKLFPYKKDSNSDYIRIRSKPNLLLISNWDSKAIFYDWNRKINGDLTKPLAKSHYRFFRQWSSMQLVCDLFQSRNREYLRFYLSFIFSNKNLTDEIGFRRYLWQFSQMPITTTYFPTLSPPLFNSSSTRTHWRYPINWQTSRYM